MGDDRENFHEGEGFLWWGDYRTDSYIESIMCGVRHTSSITARVVGSEELIFLPPRTDFFKSSTQRH